MIATGAEGGEVAVWDYELSQLLGICLGHTPESEITAIEFLAPYPVMVTAANDNKICLWTVRPVPVENSYIKIGSFTNLSYTISDETPITVRSISVYHGHKVPGISRGHTLKTS